MRGTEPSSTQTERIRIRGHISMQMAKYSKIIIDTKTFYLKGPLNNYAKKISPKNICPIFTMLLSSYNTIATFNMFKITC